MQKPQDQPLSGKMFRWLGSRNQPSHPDSLKYLLRELGQLPIEIEETVIAVDTLIGRLEKGTPLGRRRLRSVESSPHPKLKELRWKLDFRPGDYALRLYLADEATEYLGLRWQVKNLELDSEIIRVTQNLEIAIAVMAFLENKRENN